MPLASQSNLSKYKANIMHLVQGAAPEQVSGMLNSLPPAFYIVGAPRCGTTSLSKALAGHPQISFSTPKETHFLIDERPDLSVREVQRLYLESFHPNLTRDSRAIGDGSVSYLYYPQAIERAIALDSRAKFIISVRNPVDMLRSYHARLLYMLDEDITDFSQAWALQEDRRAGRYLPGRCRDAQLLQYGEIAKLGKHVSRLFALAGRERCHVVVFDDIVQNPRAVYQQLLAFLGIADDGRSRFKAKSANAGFKSRWLQQFVMNPPAWTLPLIKFGNVKTLSHLKGLRKRIKRFNKVPETQQVLSATLRTTLCQYYADDVKTLSYLLDRDLTHWLKHPDTT